MSDRGKGERNGGRPRVKKWKWLTWCHAASLHRIPEEGEEREGEEKKITAFVHQTDLSAAVPRRAAAPLI